VADRCASNFNVAQNKDHRTPLVNYANLHSL
jgi:hypothetical protein